MPKNVLRKNRPRPVILADRTQIIEFQGWSRGEPCARGRAGLGGHREVNPEPPRDPPLPALPELHNQAPQTGQRA